jgi:hypothetical protein
VAPEKRALTFSQAERESGRCFSGDLPGGAHFVMDESPESALQHKWSESFFLIKVNGSARGF